MYLNGFVYKTETLEVNLIKYSCIVIELKMYLTSLNARVKWERIQSLNK